MIKFRQIVEGLSLRPKEGFFGYSSVILIRDGEQNILFDTGGYGVRMALQKILKNVVVNKIFLSHLHFDHCANISLFQNAEIYVHENELNFLYQNKKSTYSDINDFIKRALDKAHVIPFSNTSDKAQISKNTKIICTPGHTAGHSSLEILSQSKKTIIAGDAIETYQEYINEGYKACCFDKTAYLYSKQVLKNEYSIILPGHSSIIEDGYLKDSTLSLKYF